MERMVEVVPDTDAPQFQHFLNNSPWAEAPVIAEGARRVDTLLPVQAESREQLRELLAVASGGLVFTPIQKFLPPGTGSSRREEAHSSQSLGKLPPLSLRRNIIVIADEAHRSQ